MEKMIHIRKYHNGEESVLRKLFFNTVRHVNRQDYTEAQIKVWATDQIDEKAWAQKIREIDPFVALIEDQIVGYADIQPDGYIDHFYCHFQFQGQGVGKALMQTLIETGLKQGVSRWYSHVSITAKPFFEHYGFKVTKEQSVEIEGQGLTNYIMERTR